MDSINLVTPDFTITIHDGKVTAIVTLEGGMEYTSEDITCTALGAALLNYYSPR